MGLLRDCTTSCGTDGALHSSTQGEVVTTGGGEEDAGDREPGAATSA